MNIPSAASVSVTAVQTEHEFLSLAESWNALVRDTGDSLFLQHEWFEAAWAWRKLDSQLFILVAREQQKLIGILPLISAIDASHFPAIRTLAFLTVPDTQFCDVIAAADSRERVVEAFCETLHKRRVQWDRLTLQYLDHRTTTVSELETAAAARHYVCDVTTQDRNLYINLQSTWDDYYGTRSRSLKKANNLAANRLKKTGEVAITQITAENSSAVQIDHALEQVINISRRSWKNETGNSLEQPGPGGFIKALTSHAARRGWLSMWLLSLDGTPIAMEYQLIEGGNVYALRADFDAEREEISPGSHLMRTLLESLFGQDLQRYYMGPGKNVYKARWTDVGDELRQIVVYSRTWRGRLLRFVYATLKPRVRSLRDALASRKATITEKKEPPAKSPSE